MFPFIERIFADGLSATAFGIISIEPPHTVCVLNGRLFLFGPFKRGGRHTVPSNEAFDASLRNNNPEWGVRDIEEVAALAQQNGMVLTEITGMPANNLILAFERNQG